MYKTIFIRLMVFLAQIFYHLLSLFYVHRVFKILKNKKNIKEAVELKSEEGGSGDLKKNLKLHRILSEIKKKNFVNVYKGWSKKNLLKN